MALVDEIKACRERLGKAMADAKAAAPAPGATVAAEAREKFNRLTTAAKDIGLELQNLLGQEQLEALDRLAEGPAAPPVQEQLAMSTGSVAGGGTQTVVRIDRDAVRQGAIQHGTRHLSGQEYMARYQMSREVHNAGFRAYLRQRHGTAQEAKMAAVRAMLETMKGQGAREEHLHSITDDGLGGFTASDDFRTEIIRALPGFAVVRASGARVIQTSKPTVQFPVLNRAATNAKVYSSDLTQGASNWKGEGATSGGTARTPQNKPTFGMEEIPVHIWQPDPPEITQQLLEDTDADLEGILRDLFAETLGFDLDLAFLRGDGLGVPEGILSSGAAEITVGSAAKYTTPDVSGNGLTYSGITNLFTSLAAQYRQRAVWYLNSDSLRLLLTLNVAISGTDGHPLFPANAVPGTLFNRPMFFTEFLDNSNTSGNAPILFGDPSYYVIAERRQIGIVRLVERYAPNIALQPTARIGGQLVLKEAFRIGKTAA